MGKLYRCRHRADKRTPGAAEEDVDLEKRNPLGKTFPHGKHKRVKTVPEEVAAMKPATSPGQLVERLKTVKGFEKKKDLVTFEVSRHRAPWPRR